MRVCRCESTKLIENVNRVINGKYCGVYKKKLIPILVTFLNISDHTKIPYHMSYINICVKKYLKLFNSSIYLFGNCQKNYYLNQITFC